MLEYTDISKLNKCMRTYHKLDKELRKILNTALWKFRDYRSFEEDLVSEGFIELFKAYKRFDSSKGMSFASYAYQRLKSRYLRHYLSFKYGYSGIKCLSGRCNEDIQEFFKNSISLPSEDIYNLELSANDAEDFVVSDALKTQLRDFITSGVKSNKSLVDKLKKELYVQAE